MKAKFPVYFLAVSLIASCMDFTREHYVVYKARIADYSQLAEVEIRVRDIGARWNLGIVQKHFGHLPGHNLSMYLYFDDYGVLSISGDDHTIFLSATDGSGIPLDDLERLFQEVLSELEVLGLEFKLQVSS